MFNSSNSLCVGKMCFFFNVPCLLCLFGGRAFCAVRVVPCVPRRFAASSWFGVVVSVFLWVVGCAVSLGRAFLCRACRALCAVSFCGVVVVWCRCLVSSLAGVPCPLCRVVSGGRPCLLCRAVSCLCRAFSGCVSQFGVLLPFQLRLIIEVKCQKLVPQICCQALRFLLGHMHVALINAQAYPHACCYIIFHLRNHN